VNGGKARQVNGGKARQVNGGERSERLGESGRSTNGHGLGGTAGPDRAMPIEDIQAAYARYAPWIDRFGWLDRLMTGKHRRRLFGQVEGRVLDVACGAGTNVRYLPDGVDFVGIDVSEAMLARARDELDRFDVDGRVEQMDAQALAFEDDSFDTVISSLSTCTFPDPTAALQEMARVCKPEGEIRLLEHGKSDVGPIARYQEWRADSQFERAGCRATQEPLAVVRRAGLSVDEHYTAQLGRLTGMVCRDRRTDEPVEDDR